MARLQRAAATMVAAFESLKPACPAWNSGGCTNQITPCSIEVSGRYVGRYHGSTSCNVSIPAIWQSAWGARAARPRMAAATMVAALEPKDPAYPAGDLGGRTKQIGACSSKTPGGALVATMIAPDGMSPSWGARRQVPQWRLLPW